MKQYGILYLIFLVILPSLACRVTAPATTQGSGRIATETVNVGDFDRIILNGSGDVYIKQGHSESLTIVADDNILHLLNNRVRGTTLILGIQPFQEVHPSHHIVYRLTVRNLEGLSLKGSGNFYVDNLESKELSISIPGSGNVNVKNFIGKNLTLDLHGSGNIQFDHVDTKNIDVSISGSGNVILAQGQAKNQEISIRGSGRYLAGDLETSLSEIKVPGSGDLTIWATKNLRVRVNGDGTIHYYGQPSVESGGIGSGKLVSLGNK